MVDTTPKKRPAPSDEMVVSEIVECKNAIVHGLVVGDISPIKASQKNSDVKFFESRLCDDKKMVRVISFAPQLRKDFTNAKESGEEILLRDCIIQQSKFNSQLEVLANSRTKILKSPKRFKIDENVVQTTSTSDDLDIIVSDLHDLAVNQRVNIVGKVVHMDAPMKIQSSTSDKGCLLKQDFTLADSTAATRAVLWEEKVACIELHQSYKFSNATVRQFNQKKYVSLSANCRIEKIDDIGDVDSTLLIDQHESPCRLIKGEIITVIRHDTYSACRMCKSKLPDASANLLKCTKCSAFTKANKTRTISTATMIIEDADGKEHQVTAFDDVIQQIIMTSISEATDDTIQKLMNTPIIEFTINKSNNTVTSIATSIPVSQ